ncbi:TALPID3 protein-like [Saccostrea echinata]|uniref:TALPID3 protein-like n=1 Tax=Saccostrea echinata TaxID=191078 RepID=UPI002A80CA8F|nr:TALPID3 protein-like [Saccostrea echinata]
MKHDKMKMEQLHGPSPLDPYLLPPQKELRSPYKSMPGPGKHEVPVPSSYWDAAQILQQVKENRVTLEANLEAVFRTRQEAEVYALMENLYQEGNNADMLRIRKMVDKKIALLHSQVEREVTDDVILAELQKKEAPVLIKPNTIGQQKSAPYTQRATARGRVGAKIDTGLSKIKGPSFGPPPSKAVKGKEIKPSTTTIFKPPTAKQPKIRSVFEDEEYMTKVYGKASYQNKRTTVKDPYLHYQNVPKPKPDRPAGAPDMSTAHLVKSSKTQTTPGIKQFYFSPTHGTYIPVTSAEHAPIPGQLVPMAVPLGGPRIDSGLTYSAPPPPGPLTTSTPASQPPVSALKNVAVVSVPVVDDLRKPPEPELSKQVLPSVDIDTDISETSPIPKSRPRSPSPDKLRSLSPEKDNVSLSRASTQHGEVQLRSPSKSRLEVTFHREEDEETLTDVSGDLNPEDAPGIALPGYHPPSPPPIESRQPVFPQQRLLDYNAPVVSDVLAEDIRRRDDLEKRAEEWLQQELLAKMISELCPTEVEEEPPPGLPHFVDEDSIQSEVEDKEQSMFVMDSIGRAGMQLFVDVGQPVNTDLVNSLIREVLVEKVVTALGQRPSDEKETEQRVVPKLSATVDEDKMGTTEPSPREYLYSPDQIETPQPTPKATPIASPTRVVSPPVTPELSPLPSPRQEMVRVEPPPQPVRLPPQQEAESEISESLDLSEELRILRQKLVVPVTTESVAEVHEIETPVPTPIPEEEPPQEIKPISPPPPTPRPVESPSKAVESPPVEVKQVEPPKMVQEETAVKKPEEVTEETDKNPQPWGNPESPRPEENPEYRDEMEPDQPAPMIMQPPESNVTQEDRRSPSPKRKKSPVRQPSPAPSLTESVSESSISDTINQSVSEGQWLLNKSEGEVADFPIDEVTRQRALQKALRLRAEQSMASTLKDTSEIPDESTEFPISEGEFQYNPAIAPEKDPVLLLLSRLQHGPIHPGQLDMTSAQVSDILDYTGTSTGDLSINQLRASVDRSMGEVRPKKHRRQHASPERDYGKYASPERDYGKYDYGRQLRSPSPDQTGRQSPSRGRVSPGYRETSGRKSPHRGHEYDEGGRRSPSKGRASPERGYGGYERRGRDAPHRDWQQRDQRDGWYSPQRDQRDGRYSPQRDQRDGRYSPHRDQRDGRYSPQRDQQGRRSPLRSSLESGRKSPMRVSYEMDSEGRDVERYIVETTTTTTKKTTRTPPHGTPSRRTPTRTMTPGGVSLGGSLTSGRRSPVKSALKKPPQATKSPGLPDKSVTMTGPRTYPLPGSDEQRGSQSLSDKGTRAFTPDQMNMEELLQSGYLSQTFSQSSTGRVPSPEHPQRQLSPTRLSKDKKSLGMTYSFESEGGAANSFSESELRRLADSDSLKMSVTLPSMDDSEFL